MAEIKTSICMCAMASCRLYCIRCCPTCMCQNQVPILWSNFVAFPTSTGISPAFENHKPLIQNCLSIALNLAFCSRFCFTDFSPKLWVVWRSQTQALVASLYCILNPLHKFCNPIRLQNMQLKHTDDIQ